MCCCVSLSVYVGSSVGLCDSGRCVFSACRFAGVSVKLYRHRSTSVCQDAATLAHIIPDDMGCSSRARPTININGQEQVDWELSYQGGPS